MQTRRAVAVAVVVAAALGAGAAGGVPRAGAAESGPTLTVDARADRHRIDPAIYGMSFAPPALARELGLGADRWGGNATSRYNFRNGMTNTGADWFFENVVAGTPLDRFVRRDLRHHVRPVVTVPMLGWVARTSPTTHPFACGFKISRYGAQRATDPWDQDCGAGVRPDGSSITGNDPTDTSVAVGPSFAKAMVRHLVREFGRARRGGVRTYALDNEPALWSSTHRDVHPHPVDYDELWRRSRDTALAVKAADPSAKVSGPGDWGWCAYFFSPADGCAAGADRRAHGDLPLVAWYLKRFAAYQRHHGTRLLDVLDEHFYPQEPGVALAPAGDAHTQALRLRSTRALWDPTYVDESWTTDLGLGPVELIPRMRAWRHHYYPHTALAVGEYNWGGLESVNGALAQADVLGIFGRERLDSAMLWAPPAPDQPGAFAFRIFRDYDGDGHRYGDIGVRATSSDQGRLSVYAAVRSADRATTVVVVNKTGTRLASTLRLKGVSARRARVYTYSAADLHAIVRHRSVRVVGSAVQRTYPANSITLLVLPRT